MEWHVESAMHRLLRSKVGDSWVWNRLLSIDSHWEPFTKPRRSPRLTSRCFRKRAATPITEVSLRCQRLFGIGQCRIHGLRELKKNDTSKQRREKEQKIRRTPHTDFTKPRDDKKTLEQMSYHTKRRHFHRTSENHERTRGTIVGGVSGPGRSISTAPLKVHPIHTDLGQSLCFPVLLFSVSFDGLTWLEKCSPWPPNSIGGSTASVLRCG